jgi:VanZ family protein
MSPRLVLIGSRLVGNLWLWWLGVVVWMALLWVLSSNSALPSGPSFPLKDKLLHCTYFCSGAFCFLLAIHGRSRPLPGLKSLMVPAFLFTAFIGALDEFHQTFTPGRSGNDPWDWLADVTGGVLATWIVLRVLRQFAAH